MKITKNSTLIQTDADVHKSIAVIGDVVPMPESMVSLGLTYKQRLYEMFWVLKHIKTY